MKGEIMEKENVTGKASALLPIGVFLVIFLGSGIAFQNFNAMPAIVAFLIALFAAFLQNRKVSFDDKIRIIAGGLGEENIITMSLIFLCAGGFSGAVSAAGGVDSAVNLGLSLIPAHFAVAGLFMIACFAVGGLVCAVLCPLFGGKALWGALIPLAVVFVDLLYADLKTEKDYLDRIPRGH